MPPAIPVWRDALAAVDRSPHNLLNATSPSDAGYAFPDPGLILGVTTDERRTIYLRSWLSHRMALIYRLSSSNSLARPISSQLWRTLLFFNMSVGDQNSKSQKYRQEIADILGSCLGNDGVTLGSGMPCDIIWRGQKLPSTELVSPQILQEVVWELYELNFRMEFRALDARLSTNAEDAEARDIALRECFPSRQQGDLLVVKVECANDGMAAKSWRDRAPYWIAFMQVVSTWARCPSSILICIDKPAERFTEEEFGKLEENLAMFYTQSFYNCFARAAVLPRRLDFC